MIVFQFLCDDNGIYGSYCFSTIQIIDTLDVTIRDLEFVNSSEKTKIFQIVDFINPISLHFLPTRSYVLQE